MRKETSLALLTITICALLVAGGLLASNMAFELNFRLNASAANGGVGTGRQTVALPYNRQVGLNNALELMQDIGSGSIVPVLDVSRYNKSLDVYETYSGRMGSPVPAPFALAAGEGIFVHMFSNVNYVIVGSHDPSLAISLNRAGAGSASGKNFFAPPYNITSSNCFQLMQDIGGGSITPVLYVARFNALTDTYSVYTGRMGSPFPTPFPLVPGQPFFIGMGSTVPYTASHY